MLHSLLESLPAGLDFEVILADDGSTDGTRDWLASQGDSRFKIMLNPVNLGFAKTNNAAVKVAQGELLGLLNNDLIFKPGWLEPMLDTLESITLGAGIVGNLQYRVADGALDHSGILLTPRGQFDHDKVETATLYSPRKVLAATGACLLMLRADYLKMGGFDETFVNGCEDIDLCLKFKQAGKHVYVAQGSQIQHHVSLSRSRVSLQNERNSQSLYAKWRKEIKLELTRLWAGLLQAGSEAYTDYIHGQLTQDFVTTPHNAARVIAEAMLLREEARWALELNLSPVNGDWMGLVHVRGLRYAPQLNVFLVDGDIEVAVSGIRTARNFYVCGRLISDYNPAQIRIGISVNNIHEITLPLEQGLVVNVGIINPILLSGVTNRFKVTAYFVDADGNQGKDAGKTLQISHFVVDDKIVKI
jgi:GT2 family glycosyltransferase